VAKVTSNIKSHLNPIRVKTSFDQYVDNLPEAQTELMLFDRACRKTEFPWKQAASGRNFAPESS
jgi:hypothetical protein